MLRLSSIIGALHHERVDEDIDMLITASAAGASEKRPPESAADQQSDRRRFIDVFITEYENDNMMFQPVAMSKTYRWSLTRSRRTCVPDWARPRLVYDTD